MKKILIGIGIISILAGILSATTFPKAIKPYTVEELRKLYSNRSK